MTAKNLGRHFGDLLRSRADQPTSIVGASRKGEPAELLNAGKVLAALTRLAVGLQPQTIEREGLGITALAPGDRVLIACEPRLEALLFALATWSVGAVTIHIGSNVAGPQLSEALGRMKASTIVVDNRQSLGGLELAADDVVGNANIVILDDPPEAPLPRMIGYNQLLDAGGRHRAVGLDRFAKAIFAVPDHARAAILYWTEGDALAAAALDHHEIVAAMAPLPRAWGLSGADRVLTTLPLSDRESLLMTLRVLHQGLPIAWTGTGDLVAGVASVAPRVLLTRSGTLEVLLDSLDRAQDDLSMRGALRKGLGWLERRRAEEGEGEGGGVVTDRLGGWAERGLASMLKRDLGGQLDVIWCDGPPPSAEARALLEAAGVTLTP